jgi:hypothetical protein
MNAFYDHLGGDQLPSSRSRKFLSSGSILVKGANTPSTTRKTQQQLRSICQNKPIQLNPPKSYIQPRLTPPVAAKAAPPALRMAGWTSSCRLLALPAMGPIQNNYLPLAGPLVL